MTQRTLSRRSTLALMAAATACPAFAGSAGQETAPEDWSALAADVKAEFKWAWGHYVEKAWG